MFEIGSVRSHYGIGVALQLRSIVSSQLGGSMIYSLDRLLRGIFIGRGFNYTLLPELHRALLDYMSLVMGGEDRDDE